jgi:S-adenosylmethionine:tRNA ribosyltransferase-isomerase
MQTADFTFDLPTNLIAQYPPAQRGQSRLMVMDRARQTQAHFSVQDLPALLERGTLMVFNNSRVRRARLCGVSLDSGAELEFLLVRRVDDFRWEALTSKAKKRKSGARFAFDDVLAEVEHCGEELLLRFDRAIDDAWLDIHGHVPLPPYIKRADSAADSERYQTVYARAHGSSAAPTAGLHFTDELLAALDSAGIERAFVTLHVGLGTFAPVRAERIEDHVMHEEHFHIDDYAARQIETAKAQGRKILAV